MTVMATMRTAPLDATTLTMWWNKLLTIVDEAQATLLRTAFSRIVTEAWDFSCALFDTRGEMIAQGRHGLPAFLGCMALALHDFLAAFPPHTLEPGDGLITTDPWIGASQINDVFFVTPIFHRGRIAAYAMSVSHSPDVGGRLLSADSREVFEEGFRLPIVKLFQRGEPNEDIFRIIRLNVRVPDIVVGDLLAQLASNTIMARRLVEFLERQDLDHMDELAAAVWQRSDRAMRQALAAIPAGTYRGEVETDGFDRPLTLRCAITTGGDEVVVDATGSSPQDEHGINCTWRWSFAEVAHACICVARPASPVNGATLERIRFIAPEGSIVNARYPAALGGRALVSMYLQGLIFRTLAPAVPGRVIAETGTPPHLSALTGTGNGGRRYVDIMFLNGGLGARPTMDGVSSLGWPANISGTPVEVTENEKPLLFLEKQLVPDSGGAGRQRGGLGQALAVRSLAPDSITVGVRVDRTAHPTLGLFGGRSGRPAAVTVNGEPVHPKKTVRLQPGDVYATRTAGGAGYGDPRERRPDAVLQDVLDGYVSPEAARDDYGLAIDPGRGVVDQDATRRLREAHGP
jgi:N-methylhydantoinase B